MFSRPPFPPFIPSTKETARCLFYLINAVVCIILSKILRDSIIYIFYPTSKTSLNRIIMPTNLSIILSNWHLATKRSVLPSYTVTGQATCGRLVDFFSNFGRGNKNICYSQLLPTNHLATTNRMARITWAVQTSRSHNAGRPFGLSDFGSK